MSAASATLIVLLDGLIDPSVVDDALSGVPYRVTARTVGLDDGRHAVAAGCDAVVVGSRGASDVAKKLVALSLAQRPDRPVVVLCEDEADGFLPQLFEAGADDVLVLPEQPQRVAFALEKAIARKTGAAAHGKLVAVVGPKGGTGKSVISTNLAVALARRGHRPILVDADLQFGDVALMLGIDPRLTLADLARSGGTFDADKLEGYLLEHHSGVRVLAAPLRPDEAGAVSSEWLGQVYGILRELADVVIVDCGPGFPPEVIVTIDAADDICLVGTLDAASLKDSKLGLETLELMGHDPEECRLVLNRADTRVDIADRDVEHVLGRSPDARVPSDRAVPRSVNQGEPIVLASPHSSVAKALVALAATYDGAAPAPKRGRHLLAGRA